MPSSPTRCTIADPMPAPPVTNTRITIPLCTFRGAQLPKTNTGGNSFRAGCFRSLSESLTTLRATGHLMPRLSFVPLKPPVAIRSVVIGDLVDHLGIGLKRTIPMGKTCRNPHSAPSFRGLWPH